MNIQKQEVLNNKKKKTLLGVPWWLSGIRTWCCNCSSSGHPCGTGAITGPGTSTCFERGQKIFLKNDPVVLQVKSKHA